MPASEEYKKRFKLLCEYNVKQGIPLESSFIKEEDTTEDEMPPLEQKPEDVSFEDKDAIEKAKKEEELAEKEDIDRVKEIQDLQTGKIEELERYLSNIETELEQIKSSVQDIDSIKINLDIVKDQVKEITPPTPEESLEKMAKISGGITVKDYWKEYIDEHEPMKEIVDDESTEPEFKEYEVSKSELTNFNKSDIKNTFYEYE